METAIFLLQVLPANSPRFARVLSRVMTNDTVCKGDVDVGTSCEQQEQNVNEASEKNEKGTTVGSCNIGEDSETSLKYLSGCVIVVY